MLDIDQLYIIYYYVNAYMVNIKWYASSIIDLIVKLGIRINPFIYPVTCGVA